MQLERITDKVMYIRGPANVGLVLLGKSNVALIDSGISSEYGQKILELLSDYRFKIKYILNTHSHADHTGGNFFLQTKTECRIMSSKLEIPMIRNPIIQAAVLFSGAPTADLLNKFIIPYPSNANEFDFKELASDKIEVIDIPGHSINQKGFLVDGVAFLADTLFPMSFFSKQRLPFHYDPVVQMETLKKIQNMNFDNYVGGHFTLTKNVKPMVAENIKHIRNAIKFIMDFLATPQAQDRLVKSFMDNFGLKKTGWEHFLYRATINGYLSSLSKHGKIKYRVIDNLLMWYAI